MIMLEFDEETENDNKIIGYTPATSDVRRKQTLKDEAECGSQRGIIYEAGLNPIANFPRGTL